MLQLPDCITTETTIAYSTQGTPSDFLEGLKVSLVSPVSYHAGFVIILSKMSPFIQSS